MAEFKIIEERGVMAMDQLASADHAESPLHHVNLPELGHADAADQAGVTLQEKALVGHLVLRGKADEPAFTSAINAVFGVGLPERLTGSGEGDTVIRWISPDEWLVTLPAEQSYEKELALQSASAGHFAVVNVSGGQTLLLLSGQKAGEVLQKSTSYDIHKSNFPIGKTVTTTFAKTQVVLSRIGEDRWELIVRRSFADYLWLWLQDACAEFGLAVVG